MFKLDLEKAEEREIQLSTSVGSKGKRIPEKHLFLLYWLCQSIWLCGSQQSVENSSRDRNNEQPYLHLRNLCASQEATVRTGHGTVNWLQIGKGVCQGCILSLCLFNLNAEYIMRNAKLDKAQAGIKVTRRNINNLRYAYDTTLMAGSKEELKKPLNESERGEWQSWLKTQHSKNEDHDIRWVGWKVRQIPSSYGVGGETGYTAQEDLKSINS